MAAAIEEKPFTESDAIAWLIEQLDFAEFHMWGYHRVEPYCMIEETVMLGSKARWFVRRVVDNRGGNLTEIVKCFFNRLTDKCDLDTVKWFCEEFNLGPGIFDEERGGKRCWQDIAIKAFSRTCVPAKLCKSKWLFAHFNMKTFDRSLVESLLEELRKGDSNSQQMAEWISDQLKS